MMASKKVSRQRGHRTYGYGSPKKHRGKGSRGGTGMAGSEGHRKTFLLKYRPGYGGKRGFKCKTGKKLKSINLRNLEKMAGSGKKIDLKAMGYDKVLGTGEIKAPLEVKADFFSANAKEKIEKAGGKAIGSVSGGGTEEEVTEAPREEVKEEVVAQKAKEGG